jgi:hypothetical protein
VRSDAVWGPALQPFNTGMSAAAFQAALEAFPNVGVGNVLVSKPGTDTPNRVSWSVTFVGSTVQGNMPNVYAPTDALNGGSMRLVNVAYNLMDTAGGAVTVTTTTQGNELSGGTFALTYTDAFQRLAQQTTTASVDWNAPATGPFSVQEKLQALTLLGSVAVRRRDLPDSGGGDAATEAAEGLVSSADSALSISSARKTAVPVPGGVMLAATGADSVDASAEVEGAAVGIVGRGRAAGRGIEARSSLNSSW